MVINRSWRCLAAARQTPHAETSEHARLRSASNRTPPTFRPNSFYGRHSWSMPSCSTFHPRIDRGRFTRATAGKVFNPVPHPHRRTASRGDVYSRQNIVVCFGLGPAPLRLCRLPPTTRDTWDTSADHGAPKHNAMIFTCQVIKRRPEQRCTCRASTFGSSARLDVWDVMNATARLPTIHLVRNAGHTHRSMS